MEKLCERCQKRPGSKWNGEGGWSWLCGSCKVRFTLSGARGKRFAAELSVGASAIAGQPVSVEFEDMDDDTEKN